MAHILVRLSVENYAQWRPVFGELTALRQSTGSQGGHIFRKPDSPNEVTILFHWDTVANARQYFQMPEVRQAMQRAGVQGPPDVQFLDDGEDSEA